jgi:hypothetical protein
MMPALTKITKGALQNFKKKYGALPDNVVDATDIFNPPPLTRSEESLVELARKQMSPDNPNRALSDRELFGTFKQIPTESREFQNFMGISDEMVDLKDVGVNFHEKPTYFEDISAGINSSQVKSLERAANKKFNTYNINDILANPKLPLSDLKKQNLNPEDQIRGSSFILFDPDNQRRYLANTSGADSYIRMWSNLNYD